MADNRRTHRLSGAFRIDEFRVSSAFGEEKAIVTNRTVGGKDASDASCGSLSGTPAQRLLVADGRNGAFPEAWFDAGAARAAGSVIGEAGGRGNALYLRQGDDEWVLRHYCRGGLARFLSDDRFLWLGEARTRSFAEWRLLAHMSRLGLPVPQPCAARYCRKGLTYTADIVTRRIAGASTWSSCLVDGSGPASQWREVGACVRRFHDAGVHHADLNAHNILISPDGTVHLVDFDRGRLRSTGAWCNANLARLQRSLRKIDANSPGAFYTDARWAELMAGYSAPPSAA